MRLHSDWHVVQSEFDCASTRRVMRSYSCSWLERIVFVIGLSNRDLLFATVLWRRVVVRSSSRGSPQARLQLTPTLVGWLTPQQSGGCVFRWQIRRPIFVAVLAPALAVFALVFLAAAIVSGRVFALAGFAWLSVFAVLTVAYRRWTADAEPVEVELLMSWVHDVTDAVTTATSSQPSAS